MIKHKAGSCRLASLQENAAVEYCNKSTFPGAFCGTAFGLMELGLKDSLSGGTDGVNIRKQMPHIGRITEIVAKV